MGLAGTELDPDAWAGMVTLFVRIKIGTLECQTI